MEIAKILIIDTSSDSILTEQFVEKGSPILTWNGDDDNFQTIMTSEFNFNMLSENAEDAKFYDLFTGDESRFKVEIYDENDQLFWSGFLLPDEYSEPYKNGAFFVNFTATDGLGLLKNKPFNFYNYDEEVSVVRIVAMCLQQTNLFQDIHLAEALQMSTKYWDSVLLKISNFRSESNFSGGFNQVDETEYDSCYDVLEKVLKAIGCTLFNYAGKWWLLGWNRKHLIVDNFKCYNFHGIFTSSKNIVKEVSNSFFSDGLMVRILSPLQGVIVSSDQELEEKIITEKFYYKETGEGGINPVPTPGLYDNSNPLEYWEALQGLRMKLSNAQAKRVLEGTNPVIAYESKPWCLSFELESGIPVNANRYIQLKPNNQLFIEKKEAVTILFDVDIELFSIPDQANLINVRSRTESGNYANSFRFDVLLGNTVVFSSLTNSSAYTEPMFDIKYEDIVNPEVIAGAPNNMRVRTLGRVVAKCKRTIEVNPNTNVEGKLNIRIYQPKFLLGSSIDWNNVHVSKFELTQKSKSEFKSFNLRNIKYSKTIEIDLDFLSSKSDLTKKNFRAVNAYKYYFGTRQSIVLSNKIETDDSISYSMSLLDGFWLRNNFNAVKIKKGTESYLLKDVFGDFNVLNGFYLIEDVNDTRIYFNKTKIDELFYLWNPFDGFELEVYKTWVSYMEAQDVNRNEWIKFKRFGSQLFLAYDVAYGRMMLDCKASPYSKLDGELLQLISPLNIINFSWNGQRVYWPSRLTVDLDSGKSSVVLCETKFETVNDGYIIQ